MTRPSAAENEAQNDAALDSKILETIGQALRAHYDDLVTAPLPQKFVDLLARLEVEEQSSDPEGKSNAVR